MQTTMAMMEMGWDEEYLLICLGGAIVALIVRMGKSFGAFRSSLISCPFWPQRSQAA